MLIPPNVFFIHGFCWLRYDFTGWQSLFSNTVSVVFLLALANQVLKRWRQAWVLSVGEILTIYVLLGISTSLVCVVWSVGTPLAGTISYPFWFATTENRWDELLWPNLPYWLTVRNADIVEGYYVGSSSLYDMQVIRAWAGPALWWTSFVGALFWVTLCLNSIVRRRWEEEEKLPFPLVVVPVHIADERFGLLRNRLFWIAVIGCMGLEAWNTMAGHLPSLPGIPYKFYFEQYVAGRNPWDKIPFPVIQISPLYLGMVYLIPLDLAFSLFFFDIFWDVAYMLAGLLGWNTTGIQDFPYGLQQSIGGFIAITAVFIYIDRHYFIQVLRKSLGLKSVLQDEDREGLSYRGAVLGAGAGAVYLWWFLDKAGMSSVIIWLLLLLYFAMCLGICRLRAQLGPPNHVLDSMMPNYMLDTVLGSRSLGAANVAVMGLLGPFLQGQYSNPAPLQLEALKMAEGGRMERRRLVAAMALVVPLTMICYFWCNLHYGYSIGMSAGTPNRELIMASRDMIVSIDNQTRFPTDMNIPGTAAIGAGFIFTVLLMYLKLHLPWWPLHPAGFPITLCYDMEEIVVMLFIIWLFKLLLLRYGGLNAHRRAQPFFIGLIAGHALITVILSLPSRLFGVWW